MIIFCRVFFKYDTTCVTVRTLRIDQFFTFENVHWRSNVLFVLGSNSISLLYLLVLCRLQGCKKKTVFFSIYIYFVLLCDINKFTMRLYYGQNAVVPC